MVVPFALVFGEESLVIVIVRVGEVFPLISFVSAAGPAADVEWRGNLRGLDVCDDAAGVADAIHLAQGLASGGAFHHAGVAIAGMEYGIIGIGG